MVGLGQSFHDEGLVDVWDNTTTGDSRLNKSVELLVTADSQLKMARVMRLTLRSLLALPASSRTSAVRYSRIAAE